MERYYDPTGDVLYIYIRQLGQGERYTTRAIAPGVAIDFDEGGNPIGLEVLEASRRYPASSLTPHENLGTSMSLARAAELSGLSPRTLKIQAQAGRLRAVKLGRNWVTTREWLDEYLASRKYNAKKLVP